MRNSPSHWPTTDPRGEMNSTKGHKQYAPTDKAGSGNPRNSKADIRR